MHVAGRPMDAEDIVSVAPRPGRYTLMVHLIHQPYDLFKDSP
jgi:hypothetical protein